MVAEKDARHRESTHGLYPTVFHAETGRIDDISH